MYSLNIIDKIYSSSYFTTFLVGAIVLLIILFVIVLIMGIKDSKKINQIVEEEEEPTDITLKPLEELEKDEIKEDVTFEIPSITANLENFKKNLELELQKNNKMETLNNSNKQFKVTEVNELEDTVLLNPVEITSVEEVVEEVTEIKEETKVAASMPTIAQPETLPSHDNVVEQSSTIITNSTEEVPEKPLKQERPLKTNLLDENRYEEIRKIYLSQTQTTPRTETKTSEEDFDDVFELPSLKD